MHRHGEMHRLLKSTYIARQYPIFTTYCIHFLYSICRSNIIASLAIFFTCHQVNDSADPHWHAVLHRTHSAEQALSRLHSATLDSHFHPYDQPNIDLPCRWAHAEAHFVPAGMYQRQRLEMRLFRLVRQTRDPLQAARRWQDVVRIGSQFQVQWLP